MLGITGLVKGNLTSKEFHICNLSFVLISREKENCSHWKRDKDKGKYGTQENASSPLFIFHVEKSLGEEVRIWVYLLNSC